MSARLHALDDDGVGALLLDTLCELDARDDGDDLHARGVEFFKIRDGIARAEGDECGFFLADDVDDLVLVRRHEHDVDAERAIRETAAAANLIARVLGGTSARRDDACAARVRDGGGEICLRDPCHAALQNGNLDAEQFL